MAPVMVEFMQATKLPTACRERPRTTCLQSPQSTNIGLVHQHRQQLFTCGKD